MFNSSFTILPWEIKHLKLVQVQQKNPRPVLQLQISDHHTGGVWTGSMCPLSTAIILALNINFAKVIDFT